MTTREPSKAAASGSPVGATPHVIVRKDGSELRLAAPPEARGTLLVGRLYPNGSFVSIRKGDVDEEKTASANVATAVPKKRRDAKPPNKGTSIFSNRSGLGEVVLTRPASEAARELEKASGTAKPEADRPAEKDGRPGRDEAPLTVEPHRDRNGNGEEFWRQRAGEVNRGLEVAEGNVARAKKRVEDLQSDNAAVAGQPAWAYQIAQAKEQLAIAEERLEVARKRREELAEEARKADAFPGWLR